jgi:hypothetical protein
MHPTYIFALVAGAFAPTLTALPTAEPQQRQPAPVACKDKPYPQNLNCPPTAPSPQPAQPFKGSGSLPSPSQPYVGPWDSKSPSQGGSSPPGQSWPNPPYGAQPPSSPSQAQPWPNAPYTPLSQPQGQPQPQPQPNSPLPRPGAQPKGDRPFIQNDGTGFTAHGPLGTFHKGPDGTYAEGMLGSIDSKKDGTTVYQSGMGTVVTGNGLPKYDPKTTNKNPGGNPNAGGNWGKN